MMFFPAIALSDLPAADANLSGKMRPHKELRQKRLRPDQAFMDFDAVRTPDDA
jgi:hypothetical protein